MEFAKHAHLPGSASPFFPNQELHLPGDNPVSLILSHKMSMSPFLFYLPRETTKQYKSGFSFKNLSCR
jgi:hypothetical protein